MVARGPPVASHRRSLSRWVVCWIPCELKGDFPVKPLEFYVWERVAVCMRSVARLIWDEQAAAAVVGRRYSEETITERVAVLLEEAILHEDGVQVRTFNKHEEGNKVLGNGADLALWVQLPTGVYGFHFQAKSHVSSGAFTHFKPGGSQHGMLIEAARRERANPAYLFYPAPDTAAGAHHPALDIRDFGCSASPARSDGKLWVPASRDFATLATSWAPWHHLALATTWIGDGKRPVWWHPDVGAPVIKPIRAEGLPKYLDESTRTDRPYGRVGVSGPVDSRPQRALVVEAAG